MFVPILLVEDDGAAAAAMSKALGQSGFCPVVAPSAHHRVRFRGGAKEPMLRAAAFFAVIGLALLTLAMSAVLYLVTDVVYRSTVAALVAGGFGIAVGLLWFVLPQRDGR